MTWKIMMNIINNKKINPIVVYKETLKDEGILKAMVEIIKVNN